MTTLMPFNVRPIHIHHLGLSEAQRAQAETIIENLDRPDRCVTCGAESRWVITWVRHPSIMILPVCRACTDPEVAKALEAKEAAADPARIFGAGVAEA